MSGYQRAPHQDYPPPGYVSPYPPLTSPATAPSAPAPPYEGDPQPPPPVYTGYPPPRPPRRPQHEGYQAYFNRQYPRPPRRPDLGQHYHHDPGLASFLQGCLAILCCCCVLEECF